MARAVPLDFLIISPLPVVALATLAASLAVLRLGALDATEEPGVVLELGMPPGQDRQRLGRIFVRETLARAEAALVIERFARPVLQGLAPTALDRLALGLDPARQQIVRTGTLSIDVRATLHDPDRAWDLHWAMLLVEHIARQAQGIIFDPAAQRCVTPDTLVRQRDLGPIGQIALHNDPWGPETRWLHTHGLQKFGQPELEIVAVPQSLEAEAAIILRTVAETLATGDGSGDPVLRAGMQVECDGAGLLFARQSQTDADHRGPAGRLRLVSAPIPGAATPEDATEAIIAAAHSATQTAITAQAWAEAQRHLDRVLTAVPDHLPTLALKARLLLAEGQPDAAVELGAFMTLRAPTDGRGAAVTGMALLAQGRIAEALEALNRAIALDPDDPELFETRARLYERQGRLPEAASDRARARMLRG